MSPNLLLVFLLTLLAIIQDGSTLYCHRCYSAMGGCLHNLNLWQYPWKWCGPSDFCVKYIEKVGSEYRIIRECEHILAQTTRHRMQMPVLRRHGYCMPARINDPQHPERTVDDTKMYCFCNEWDGCNGGGRVKVGVWALIAGVLVSVLVKFS